MKFIVGGSTLLTATNKNMGFFVFTLFTPHIQQSIYMILTFELVLYGAVLPALKFQKVQKNGNASDLDPREIL